MHIKNRHKNGYKFDLLLKANPSLSKFIQKNKFNNQDTINFSDPLAVKSLNYSLLKSDYQINYWDFPEGYLCPAIPGRVDYIHSLHDLLVKTSPALLPQNTKIRALDIGTGASCIYPLLGQHEYNWHFIASDVDPISINAANEIITKNNLSKKIQCRIQTKSSHVFKGVISENEFFHLTLCNPPFHKSLAEATKGTTRKWKNLSKSAALNKDNKQTLNFGGQKAELWCPGGELAFIKTMIKESCHFKKQVLWFTCLVSKKEHLSKIKLYLKKAQVSKVEIVNMTQGNKSSRFIAWSFI